MNYYYKNIMFKKPPSVRLDYKCVGPYITALVEVQQHLAHYIGINQTVITSVCLHQHLSNVLRVVCAHSDHSASK